MHYLYIFEFWYVTSCLLVLTCSEDWKTVFETSWSTHHIYPPSTSYTFSTYRRLIMRSEVLKGWTSHSLNLFCDDRYLEENLLISKNKEAFLCQSVSVYVGFKFASTIFCALGDGGRERVIIRRGGRRVTMEQLFSFLVSRGSTYAHYYLLQAQVQLSGGHFV